MLLHQLVATSAAVAATRSRTTKIALLAAALAKAAPDEIEPVTSYLSGALLQRRTGVGWRGLPRDVPPAVEPSLTVRDVDRQFDALSQLQGPGSATGRRDQVQRLMAAATADEQAYLAGLVTGETRQGALDGLMQAAVSAASGVPLDALRRAVMFAGSTPAVAAAALVGGSDAVKQITLVIGRPARPMLASSAKTVAEAMIQADASGDPVAVEAKWDGIRIQAHRDAAGVVRLFTRSLDEITERLPEIVATVARLPGGSLVLDGEVLRLDQAGRPRPFQETASRSMSRSADQAEPLSVAFFDILERDGRVLVDQPAIRRLAILSDAVPPQLLVDRLVSNDPEQAAAFADTVLASGHEGVVVKSLSAPYEAGRRGASWVKVKPVHTLDLVVLAVEEGSGRRRGTLSNIHLGARDPSTGGFVMLGKTFKGMTDEMLAWQTRRFTELMVDRSDWVVRVRPEQVVEIAFDGVQRSSRYPAGLALRFARVVRYRDDKTADEADTIETVRRLAGQLHEG